jgi:hypothetical protein
VFKRGKKDRKDFDLTSGISGPMRDLTLDFDNGRPGYDSLMSTLHKCEPGDNVTLTWDNISMVASRETWLEILRPPNE